MDASTATSAAGGGGGGGGEAADLVDASMELDSDLYGDDLYGGLGDDVGDGQADEDDAAGGGGEGGDGEAAGGASGESTDAAQAGGLQEGFPAASAGDAFADPPFSEPPMPYEKQAVSYSRLQLGMRAQQGKRSTDKLVQSLKLCFA